MTLALLILILALSAAIPIALLVRWLLQRRALARAWRPGPEVAAAVQARAEALASPRTDLIPVRLPAGVRPSTAVGCYWSGELGCLRKTGPCTGEAGCERYLSAREMAS